MNPLDPFIEAARMCASANGWEDRFKRYEHLLINTGMTEEDAEREVTEAYHALEIVTQAEADRQAENMRGLAA